MNANSENIDEIIDNMRYITDNMREFTDTIKTRPYTLIRTTTPKAHKPGEAPPSSRINLRISERVVGAFE